VSPDVRPAAPPDLALDAPGKINLFLEILGRRPDGFHEIETVMQAVDLADRLEFWRRPAGEIGISISGGEAPADESNLAVRAARLLREESGRSEGVHIHIAKQVPTGGGMGGGSSDAAAALRGLNRLWKVGAGLDDLTRLGAQLGSDVNFFLRGGLAVCRGRGEIVEPISGTVRAGFLLHFPEIRTSTREIYAKLGFPLKDSRHSYNGLLEGLFRDDLAAAGRGLFNRLETPAFEAYPQLAAAKEKLRESKPCGALLSGSGSTIYVLAAPGDLDVLARGLSEKLRSESLRPVRPVGGWEF
jgi:4-diphosphocytidyl-2-C-methyl-D-erythritol kinase